MSTLPAVPDELRRAEPFTWVNPRRDASATGNVSKADVAETDARLRRFAPFLAETFDGPWHEGPHGVEPGVIDSPLTSLPQLADALGLDRPLWAKRDDLLPISGSVKARGGIYEVLAVAERIAIEHGFSTEDDYRAFAEPQMRDLLSRYIVAVGSTGNLGLSIGTMARALGFQAVIHMSADARAWKKHRLRSLGAEVIEYEGDYGRAVETGREQARGDDRVHFVDDESSRLLFLGYAVAGRRIGAQLAAAGITPGAERPLHVHLPCGVGGGPGGILVGLHLGLGDAAEHIHGWYAEPTQACCMTLSLATGLGDRIAVSDIGLDGRTAADGLAVGRSSALAYEATQHLVAGAYTVRDEEMFRLLRLLDETEGIHLEPSALAGVAGPLALCAAGVELPEGAAHLAWATGGSMVPDEEMATYLQPHP
ncbi:MAG: D-serine ammonia-lyase [Mobilicoccus sp.]|nr:D-serine ammonia-lyase [Mobilicoccus sp.]